MTLPQDDDTRENNLRHAARMRGLSLIRATTGYVLVEYKLTGATLDEIERFLGTDGSREAGQRRREEQQLADKTVRWLNATLKMFRKQDEERERDLREMTESLKTARITSPAR
jgi:flagellar motility protein MotE (MotC chaperone)